MNQLPSRKRKNRRPKRKNSVFSTTLTLRQIAPDSVCVPLTYVSNADLSGGGIVEKRFNLNSLYDPDASGVGDQPLGFDQWCAFYARYRVDYVDVTVDFLNNSVNSVSDVLMIASNSSSAISTTPQFEAACESPFSQRHLLPLNLGMNMVTFKQRFYLHAITGVKRVKYETDDNYAGTVGSSPTEDLILHVVAKDFDLINNTSIKARVKLVFQSTFYDRVQLTIS